MKPVQDMNAEEISRLTTAVLNSVKATLPKGTGFAVLYAPHTAELTNVPCQYGANVQRADMITMMRETARRLEMDPRTREEYLQRLRQKWAAAGDDYVAELFSGAFGVVMAIIHDGNNPEVPNDQHMNFSVFMQNYAERERRGCLDALKVMLRNWLEKLESA